MLLVPNSWPDVVVPGRLAVDQDQLDFQIATFAHVSAVGIVPESPLSRV